MPSFRLTYHLQVGQGTWGPGVYDYKDLPFAGAVVTENMTDVASYSYDAATQELVSYDTPNIVAAKANYVVKNGLAGGMFWEVRTSLFPGSFSY